MTLRLYYEDPYQTRFTAGEVEQLFWLDRPAVVLDRTAFYPTAGGQPHDTGHLNGVPVLEVLEREADGAVVHLLAEPLRGNLAEVEGQVHWERRFDLMQQHTGQHILSAASVQQLGANTVGFHLATDYATIDLDQAPLSADQLAKVENLANQIVFDNRPVTARFAPDTELPGLPLRKPVVHHGPVRVVEIPGFDCSACGGTHVRATGEIGLIKIVRSERRTTDTRVEFLCGLRALVDYRAKNNLLTDLARTLSVGHWELVDTVNRLERELRETRRALRQTGDALQAAEAEALWREARPVGDMRVVQALLPNRSADDLKHLAQQLASRPRTVALLAAGGETGAKASLVFARSAELDLHMGTLMRQACDRIAGRGGGRPELAQGGGPSGEHLAQALAVAFQAVVDA